MTRTARFTERPWIAPEACPGSFGDAHAPSELRGAIERAEEALNHGSVGATLHALLAARAAIRTRLANDEVCSFADGPAPLRGPWKRRLRRRYEASLCSLQRLLDRARSPGDRHGLQDAVAEELARLRGLASLEDQVALEQYWTDLGVGD